MLTRRTRPIVGGFSLALVVFASWLVCGWGGPFDTAVVSIAGLVLFSAFAFGCTTAAAIVSRTDRRYSWAAFAIGLFGWMIGDLIWLYYQVVGHSDPPFPSVADFAFLLLPVVVFGAWIASPPGGRRLGLRTLLDAAAVASALFLVAWVAVLDELFDVATVSRLQLALTVAHPLTDVAIVTMAVLVMTSAPASHRRTVGVVAAGLIVISIADSALVYLRANDMPATNPVMIMWACGLVILGIGALLVVGDPGPGETMYPNRSRFALWLPFIPMPIAVVFGFMALWPVTNFRPVLVSAAIMVTAALIRQLIVVAENRDLIDTVAEQALRDPLTGLANRVLFTDEVAYALRLQQQDGREVAVLSLDLDDFKLVNDDLGHSCGDALLQAVANRLLNCVLPSDTVARLGGDEFAVLMQDGPIPVAEVANRVIEGFDKPFFLDGEELFIHPSVGMADSPVDESIGPDELFKRADLAMCTAKKSGTGGVQKYVPDMHYDDKRQPTPVAGIQLIGQLRRAVDDGDLTLVYQPKIDLRTGGIVGVEALVRWPHPELGVLTPNQFLPLVRRIGLMGAVTELVLHQAVRDAASWFDETRCVVPVAINLFAPSLNDLTLPQRISAALERHDLPSSALSVEITEHLLVADTRRASAVITRLRASGLRISIDDFGSGYSTMSYLRDLAVDELKLDRQFIVPILRSVRAAAIVRSVVDLAHTLGIVSVAEGVEDKATADRLAEYGCDVAQGHYFSRPVSADELRGHLQLEDSSSAIFPITN